MKTFRALLACCLLLGAYGFAITPEKPAPLSAISATQANNNSPTFDGRIVGGSATTIRAHPYQVSVQYKNKHICGGSIALRKAIITAAHCVEFSTKAADFTVRVGSTILESGGQLLGVRRIHQHEAYSSRTMHNDIAILELAGGLNFSLTVKPIKLPALLEVVPNNGNLIVSGWGMNSELGLGLPLLLHHVAVRAINENVCTQTYKQLAPITGTMFCAGYLEGGRDSCQGDSGGPLASYVNDEPTLMGIVSWGVGCARKGYPGVYTKVSVLRPWILSKFADINK